MSGRVFAGQDPHPEDRKQKSQTVRLILGKLSVVLFDNVLLNVIASLSTRFALPQLIEVEHNGETAMTVKAFGKTFLIAALLAAGGAQAQDVVRLGNLKFAHYGAVSYIKEIAPKCGIKVEERVFAKGLDVMQAIIAGEIDVGTTASEAAISGRAGNAPIYVVAGFAKGGARLVTRPELGIKSVKDLKGKKVGV